jgi:hypothetical protein
MYVVFPFQMDAFVGKVDPFVVLTLVDEVHTFL